MRHDPRELGAKCPECPFAKNGTPHRPVLGEGPSDPVGILVGEAPSRDDAELGRPFSGQTGRVLDDELISARIPRNRLFIVNAVCCQAASREEKDFRRAVQCCRPAFLHQLASFPPATPLFAMGQWAVEALGLKFKVGTGRGFVREHEVPRADR